MDHINIPGVTGSAANYDPDVKTTKFVELFASLSSNVRWVDCLTLSQSSLEQLIVSGARKHNTAASWSNCERYFPVFWHILLRSDLQYKFQKINFNFRYFLRVGVTLQTLTKVGAKYYT